MGANIQSGFFGKVTQGRSTLLAGAGQFDISGATRGTVVGSEFGQDVDQFVEGTVDSGTVSIANMLFDPHSTVQRGFTDALKNRTRFSKGVTEPRFWTSDTTFFALDDTTGAYYFASKAGGVSLQKNGLAQTSAEFKVSGGYMTWYKAYTLDGALAADDVAMTVNEAIDVGTPATGRIKLSSTVTVAYSAYDAATKTFTIAVPGVIIADDTEVFVLDAA